MGLVILIFKFFLAILLVFVPAHFLLKWLDKSFRKNHPEMAKQLDEEEDDYRHYW